MDAPKKCMPKCNAWPQSSALSSITPRRRSMHKSNQTKQSAEAPEAVTDSTGEVVGIDLDPDELSDATEHTSPVEGSYPMAMQMMYNGPLQTRARHAILCFTQLELRRPIAPSVLQPQHRHTSTIAYSLSISEMRKIWRASRSNPTLSSRATRDAASTHALCQHCGSTATTSSTVGPRQ